MKSIVQMILLLCFGAIQASSQVAIGNWTDHLSYQHATRIAESGPLIYVSAFNAVFSLNVSDQSIERLSKFSGLSETGVACIAASTTTLVIGYKNGNIDIIANDIVTNLNGVTTNQSLPNKSLYDIQIEGSRAYICAAFGIVVIDLQKKDIIETYYIGGDAEKISVYSLARLQDQWFASTSEGVKSAAVSGVNLQDYKNWTTITSDNLPAGSARFQLLSLNDTLFYRKTDTIFRFDGAAFERLYIASGHINALRGISGRLVSLEVDGNNANVVSVSASGTGQPLVPANKWIRNPADILERNGELFIADSLNGLVRFTAGEFSLINPSSPAGDNIIALFSSKTSTWVGAVAPVSLSGFVNRNWQNYTATSTELLRTNRGFQTIIEDPGSKDVYAGSLNDGLLKIDGSSNITRFKEGSFIIASNANPSDYPVTGLAYDASNTLWISNSGTDRPLIAKTNDEVYRFSAPFTALGAIVIDDVMQKWIISPGTGLLCFNSGADLSNTADDQWKIFQSGIGAGNLPTNNVLSIAKDHNNFIWVGTSSGIGIIQCPELVFTNQACEALLPVVQQGNFNGYLFRGEQVQSIAVDGADRKWIGTTNGAWLISRDGASTIQRFNTDNSPIPSNDIRYISINPSTGEVYFGTANGLCSYRGTATEASENESRVIAFPNPVPPGYSGIIAIRGLPANSTIKITELNGRLVHQGKANGGLFTWNGINYLGRKAASGIYLVLVSTEDRKESLAIKIFILNK